ncbi:trypsin, alkaline C-like [Manduca sexta]|uniref:trypsin, alkaline C-like n=1 Tax=Manduca sexta TaxID=7130 RepID=UPI0018904599|nr:trypsin, alkaline C-like [Manduca sexta]
MMQWLVIALALFAGNIIASTASRIVGGQLTTIDRYPSLVQVEFLRIFTWSQSCAANILNNFYVLSAAHCFEGLFYDRSRRRIRGGATFRNTGGEVIGIVREFNHPDYDIIPSDADITVVRLSAPIIYNPVMQQGMIVPQGFEIPDNMPVVHAGWGATRWLGLQSSQLQDVTIYTVNRQLCAERYLSLHPSLQITGNMICAGILDVGGKDACQGDSGGPMYFGGVIVGIVSWGHRCANATFPGVSTAVGPYTDWIVSTAV